MKAFKFALATILLLGAVGATLVVNPILAQTPNPGPEAKPNEVVVFALKNASASEVARVLGEIFNGPRQGDGARRNTISVAVDPRVNSVVVFAPPARLDEIKALIARLEEAPTSQATQPTLKVFPLRFAEPDKALEAALQLAMTGNGQFTIDRLRKQVIISSNDDAVLKQVQELLGRLDVISAERGGADVQVRIVWLVHGPLGEDFNAPPDDIKDVLPALAKLGIEKPRLAAQTIVNATPNSQFRSDGTVKLNELVHLSVTGQFLERSDPAGLHVSIKAGGTGGEICNVSTDISAPMGHFVVLGVTPTKDWTSVFVVQLTRKEAIKPSR